MGIKRLFHYLRPAFLKYSIKNLEGKTIGIDASSWIYQAMFSSLFNPLQDPLFFIRHLEFKRQILESSGLKYIFVLDGKEIPSKKQMLLKRKSKRTKYIDQSKNLESQNNISDIEHIALFNKYGQEMSQQIKYLFIDYLKERKVKYMVAPYEADSQLAFLYNSGQIDYVMTEDSDLLAYGCDKIINGLKANGQCKILNLNKISKLYDNLITFSNLKGDDRAMACILSGCDYLKNQKGFGFIFVMKQYKETNPVEQLQKRMIARGMSKQEVSQYLNEARKVLNSFMYPIIYDNKLNKLAHLNQKEGEDYEWRYTGEKFQDFERYVLGDLNFETMEEREQSCFDLSGILKFIDYVPEKKNGLRNLTEDNYTYSNFNELNSSGRNFI